MKPSRTPGPKHAVQLDETHDLSAFLHPVEPVPARVQSAIDRGVRDGDVSSLDDPNLLLDIEGGGDGLVDDVVRLSDGRLVVACLTEMPNVTSTMWDWWFAWHSYSNERYRLWHPDDHLSTSFDEDRRQVASIRDRWVGNTSYVDEYIGGQLQRLAIRFVDPADAGLDRARVDEIGLAVCARTVLRRERLAAGRLIHLIEDTSAGCRMHSRFYLGELQSELPIVGEAITRVVNTGRIRRSQLGDRSGTGLLLHCAQEMNHLAGILPALYERFGDE